VTAGTCGSSVRLTLIRNDPPCRKCREAKAALAAVAHELGNRVELAELTVAEAAAAGYAIVLTPTVLVNGKVLCAGVAPRAAGIARVVAAELQRPS
jgi:hypothetical protein